MVVDHKCSDRQPMAPKPGDVTTETVRTQTLVGVVCDGRAKNAALQASEATARRALVFTERGNGARALLKIHQRRLDEFLGVHAGFVIGFILRALCGEPLIHVPVIVQLPLYDDKRGQQFPFRTVCMVISFATMLGVSVIAKNLFATGVLPTSMDVWHCFEPYPEDEGSKKAADRPTSDAKMNIERATSHTAKAGATLKKPSVAQVPGAPSSHNRPPKDAVSPNLSQADKTVHKVPKKKPTRKASKEGQDASETLCNKK